MMVHCEQFAELDHDARGAVFVEKLIVYIPLMLTFFLTWELAELGAASIVVQRACSAAGRAAVVVLADDPIYYEDEPVGSYDGRRREDIELAAGMVLSAIPKLTSEFEVDVSAPKDATSKIEVSLVAPYDCTGISLICGFDSSIELSATSEHTYQGASYEYGAPTGGVGSSTGALTAEGASNPSVSEAADSAPDTSGGGSGYRAGGTGGTGGASKTCKMPSSGGACLKRVKDFGKHVFADVDVTSCGSPIPQIRANFTKVLDSTKLRCVTKAQAADAYAKDMQVRERNRNGDDCTCVAPDYKSFVQDAEEEFKVNKCRGFTNYRDEIFLIVDKPGKCPPDDYVGDLLHEAIHVMSGDGGKNPIQAQSTPFNEAVTQWWTEQSATGPITDAYKDGAPGEWMKCIATLSSEPGFREALCKSYFQGDEDALSRFVLARYKRNMRWSDKTKSDDELVKLIGEYKMAIWETRICK